MIAFLSSVAIIGWIFAACFSVWGIAAVVVLMASKPRRTLR